MPTWLFLAALATAPLAGYRLWRHIRARRQVAADEAEELAIERYELAWQSATYHWVGLDRVLRHLSVGATALLAVVSTGVLLATTPPAVERWAFHPSPTGSAAAAAAIADAAPEGAPPAAPQPGSQAPPGGSGSHPRPAAAPANPVRVQPAPALQTPPVAVPAIASSTRLAPPSPSPSPLPHSPSPSPSPSSTPYSQSP